MTTSEAVAHLRRGGLLIYPTETAYALGCDATNARAVRAIFRLKGRERGKPLPLIVASRAMVDRYAHFTTLARRLAKRHWPGPLTIVAASRFTPTVSPPLPEGEREGEGAGSARGKDKLAPGVTASDGSIALRISSHPIARALSRALGRPIISTSANRSGNPPCYTVRSTLHSLGRNHFLPLFQRGSDSSLEARRAKWERGWERGARGGGVFVLDIGQLPRRHPSTIVDARGDALHVLRRGTIRV